MKYKIYYKSTGFITGILSENDLSDQINYEVSIDYDNVVDGDNVMIMQIWMITSCINYNIIGTILL